MKDLTNQANLDQIAKVTQPLQSMRYRKWLADGRPRTSLHLRLSPSE